jgi:hypothetical protein
MAWSHRIFISDVGSQINHTMHSGYLGSELLSTRKSHGRAAKKSRTLKTSFAPNLLPIGGDLARPEVFRWARTCDGTEQDTDEVEDCAGGGRDGCCGWTGRSARKSDFPGFSLESLTGSFGIVLQYLYPHYWIGEFLLWQLAAPAPFGGGERPQLRAQSLRLLGSRVAAILSIRATSSPTVRRPTPRWRWLQSRAPAAPKLR